MTQGTVEIDTGATPAGKLSVSFGLSALVTAPGQRPPLFLARDEKFFWTREWQAGERESETERRAGNLRRFGTSKDLLDWLRAPED